MSDIKCAVCGEPWDLYGVSHGDMAKWEAELFRKGAGCPCCKGVGGDHVEEHLLSVVMESEDPDAFPLLHGGKSPKWERPEDGIVLACAGCDSKIKRNIDDDGEVYWDTPTVDRYYHNRPGGYDWSTDLDEVHEIGGKRYCFACATTCDGCNAAVFRADSSCTGTVLYSDLYDPGASHPDPDDCHGTVCTYCLESWGSDEDDESARSRS